MTTAEAILIAASLCADCFAVSLCSSVTMKRVDWKNTAATALAFAIIQTGLLAAGWWFGYALSGAVEKISHYIGFLLLLYVGGSMLLEGIRGAEEGRDLRGLRNIIIGGVATSIDAMAVGIAMSMKTPGSAGGFREFLPLPVSVFVITALSVILGIYGGKAIGYKFGRRAEIAGGIILIGIGVTILL